MSENMNEIRAMMSEAKAQNEKFLLQMQKELSEAKNQYELDAIKRTHEYEQTRKDLLSEIQSLREYVNALRESIDLYMRHIEFILAVFTAAIALLELLRH